MFRKFRVQNFMSLKDVTVELEPLTIFAGPNSSGKSAFFKALTTFCKLQGYPVRGGRTGDFNVDFGTSLDDVVWNRNSSHPIIFEVWLDDPAATEPDYTLELTRDYSGWSITRERFSFQGNLLDTSQGEFRFQTSEGWKSWPGPYRAPLAFLTWRYNRDPIAGPYIKPIQDLRERLGQARRYRPSASDIASFINTPSDSESRGDFYVDEAGRGLALVLRDLLTGKRETFSKIEEQLATLHHHVRGINFRTDWRGLGLFYKTDRAPEDTPASLESDGVLLSTFLLWLLHTAHPNLKLCLEEPENGVHISFLRERYQLLKQFTGDNEGIPKAQILVATHSRDFLNAIDRSDLVRELRITEFSPSTGTAIYNLKHWRQIDQLLDEFRGQMGDLWWSRRLELG